MSKYCPSCGNKSADLINYCWNCGQYLGKGHIKELETPDSATRVREELKLDKRENLPQEKQFANRDETSLALVTIYGVTKGDLVDILNKNNIDFSYAPTPGLCTPDEAMTNQDIAREEAKASKGGSSSGYGSSYYYDDPTTAICCYYGCYPRYRYSTYRSNSSCCSSSSGSSSSNCDCDGDSDSDIGAAIIVVLVIIALIAILIFLGPSLIAAGLVILDLLIAFALLIFNIITLGVYKDDLSRTRIRINKASSKDLDNLMSDLNTKRGLPRMPGYWTNGFLLIRYGALFFVTGLIFVGIMLFIQPDSKILYYLPTGVVIISIIGFIYGHYLIKKKLREVQVYFG